MQAFRWAAVVIAAVSALLALRAGMIDISDNIDTFTQELAHQGRWVVWGAVANVVAAACSILAMTLDRPRQ